MKKTEEVNPPRWADKFLEWYCRPELVEDLQGDLHEFFIRNVQARGAMRARLIYIMDVLKFFRSYTVRKPKLSPHLSQSNMIRSYVKTSGRSIIRHKLFSFINIAGLAISMCVGLLVISFLSDLYSYDDFQEKKDRIYRVVTTDNNLIDVALVIFDEFYDLRNEFAAWCDYSQAFYRKAKGLAFTPQFGQVALEII